MVKRIDSYTRIQNIGIIGAGLMGVEIAAANVRSGFPVWICDANPAVLETFPQRLAEELALDGDPEAVAQMLAMVTPCPLEELAQCNLLIEAIVENFDVKAALYQDFKPFFRPGMIFATNTSTIPIERLATVFPFPKNFAGLHFLHPVWNRELVEVIPSTQACEMVTQRLCDYVLSLEKTPLCVGDCPGFVVNRLLQPYLNEAMLLLQDGIPMENIEHAAEKFGWEWGPLRIMDEIGIDVIYHCGRVLYSAYPDRVIPSPILVSMMKKKYFGRKSGLGFYDWGENWRETLHDHTAEPVGLSAGAQAVVDAWKNDVPTRMSLPDIAGRLTTAMALEAARIVVDDVVSEQGQVDMAAVIGLGFPETRRGPLAWFAKEAIK